MNLFIIHHHLLRGGVHRVIASQVESLKDNPLLKNIYILSGRLPEEEYIPGTQIIIEELLDYLHPDCSFSDYKEKQRKLYDFLKSTITKKDIIHVHNPTLGKNPLLTYVLYRLAGEGYTLFYHCHDFAEDRPGNYMFLRKIITDLYSMEMNTVMYPENNKVIFGVLNSLDAGRLKSLGISENRIKVLPNPVKIEGLINRKSKAGAIDAVCKKFSLDPDLPIMLYPVRVIRRKNIGEYLLCASIFTNKASWLVTLAPKNPVEIEHYQRWKEFAKRINSPVIFEAGDKMDFDTLMFAAYRAITTSKKEGFGMCFLEPWAYNTPVAGRTIPYVLADFRKHNIQFLNLYNRLEITWKKETEDFSSFPAETQMEIIETLLTHEKIRNEFLSGTGIEEIVFKPVPENILVQNIEVIKEHYSLQKYGTKLDKIYRELSEKG